MIKIYSAQKTKELLNPVSSGVFIFRKNGLANYMYKSNGFKTLSADMVKKALEGCKFPLEWLSKANFEIFIFPHRLCMVDRKLSPSGSYEGQAFENHFVLGARQENYFASVARVAIHELGHILTYQWIDDNYKDHIDEEKMIEYAKLRGLDRDIYAYDRPWNYRLWEWFAEDFCYLFSPTEWVEEYKRIGEGFIWNRAKGEKPSKEIKEFILNYLVPKELMDGKPQFQIVGKEEETMKDIKGHWAEQEINYVIKEGLMEGYEDGTFRPDEEITRAEIAAILSRL